MADNTELNAASGGDTIGTDDIGGVKYQRVKIIQGADGTNDGDVSAAAPLNITHAPRNFTFENFITLASTSETTLLNTPAFSIFQDLSTLVISKPASGSVDLTFRDDTAGGTFLVVHIEGPTTVPAHVNFTPYIVQPVAQKPITVEATLTDTIYIYASAIARS